MMEEKNISNIPAKNTFFPLVLTQLICVAIILSSLVAIKYISPKIFKKTQKWCIQNILSEADFQRLLEETENEI